MISQKTILSNVWIFATLNYLYCDVLGLFDTNVMKQILAGAIGDLQITQGFLIGASVLMEIPIAMVLMSRLLAYRYNRWANVIAGTIMTSVQIGSLFFGSSVTIYYAFFSVIEITSTAFIVWYAWRWVEVPQPAQAL